jgi:aryl-alcohol dehydrogenase-like predicted oxidoreductase
MKSKIIIGTWPLSGDYGNIDLNQIQQSLEFCYENGLKEFDTAPNYGNGFMEFCLGKVFQQNSDVQINTKIGNLPFGKKSFDIESLKKSFNESLKRLNKKSINTLFLHNPRNDILDYDKIIDFMEKLKNENMIKCIGLSKAKDFDYDSVVELNRFDVIQDDVNLLYLDSIKKQKLSKTIFMARSPLASGLLSGRITKNTIFANDDHRHSWLKEERLESLLRRINVIKENSGIELPILAMKFVLNLENVDKVIFGIKKIEHIKKILELISDYKLNYEVIDKFKMLYEKDFGLINEKQYSY